MNDPELIADQAAHIEAQAAVIEAFIPFTAAVASVAADLISEGHPAAARLEAAFRSCSARTGEFVIETEETG